MSKRSKPAAKYRGLSFPVPLLEEIKIHISNKPEYRSVSEFIRESISEKMNEPSVTKDRFNDKMFNTINRNTTHNFQELNQKLIKIENSIKKNHSDFIRTINYFYLSHA